MAGNRRRVGNRSTSTLTRSLKTLNSDATDANAETGATVKNVEGVKIGAVSRLGIEKFSE